MWKSEDDSKAQPDVAAPALGLATIRGGELPLPVKTGGAGGWQSQGTGGPRGGQRVSRTGSERAAAGRVGPAGEVTGCGFLGCLWSGKPRGA